MYVWKCWHDTRALFFVFLAVAVIVMPLSVAFLGSGLLTDSGTIAVSSTMFLLNSIMALGLGALLATEQFADKTIHFLFTKPRSRPYFLWVGWAVGCMELLTVAAANLFAGWIALLRYSKAPITFSLWDLVTRHSNIVRSLTYCVLLYCLTYAVTAALRNGLKGLGGSILLISGLQSVAIAIRLRWAIHIPIPAEPIGSLSPTVSMVVWLLLGVVLVAVAQIRVERAEI